MIFFIEQGQGISSMPGQHITVVTSALYSCTFIAASNAAEGRAGAFHFPAGDFGHRPTVQALVSWLHSVNPTHVKLVYASDGGIPGMGTSTADKNFLRDVVEENCPKLTRVNTTQGVTVGMSTVSGFEAGSISGDEVAVNAATSPINVNLKNVEPKVDMRAGYVLFGSNRGKNIPSSGNRFSLSNFLS